VCINITRFVYCFETLVDIERFIYIIHHSPPRQDTKSDLGKNNIYFHIGNSSLHICFGGSKGFRVVQNQNYSCISYYSGKIICKVSCFFQIDSNLIILKTTYQSNLQVFSNDHNITTIWISKFSTLGTLFSGWFLKYVLLGIESYCFGICVFRNEKTE